MRRISRSPFVARLPRSPPRIHSSCSFPLLPSSRLSLGERARGSRTSSAASVGRRRSSSASRRPIATAPGYLFTVYLRVCFRIRVRIRRTARKPTTTIDLRRATTRPRVPTRYVPLRRLERGVLRSCRRVGEVARFFHGPWKALSFGLAPHSPRVSGRSLFASLSPSCRHQRHFSTYRRGRRSKGENERASGRTGRDGREAPRTKVFGVTRRRGG